MNRNDEFFKLYDELEQVPTELQFSVARARAQLEKSKRRKLWKIPTAVLSTCFACFIILVNTSTAFASACQQIPLLKELAQAVSFSKSLTAAVDNQYVQPIGLEKTQNGITMRIEHVIVDQRQLNIFYTLQSEQHTTLRTTPALKSVHDEELEGYSLGSNEYDEKQGKLKQYTVDFFDQLMPSSLILKAQVYSESHLESTDIPVKNSLLEPVEEFNPDYITTFEFQLDFDPSFTAQGEIINLDSKFLLDGQNLSLETAEIFPTHMRLVFDDVAENTAWLRSLNFYIENEKGEKYDKISNGITASGKVDSPMMATHMLESPFFSRSKHLSLYITGAKLLNKDVERIKINLKEQTAEALPEGVSIHKISHEGNSWILEFDAISDKENHSFTIFSTTYYDESGEEYSYNSWSTTGITEYDEKSETYVSDPYKFRVSFALVDYPYDTVYLCPDFSHTFSAETPTEIVIK